MNERYEKHIASSAWKRFRRDYHTWRISNGKKFGCDKCGASKIRLEVHHLTYERLGEEKFSDVILLCHVCHKSVHGRNTTSVKKLTAAQRRLMKRYKRARRQILPARRKHVIPGLGTFG